MAACSNSTRGVFAGGDPATDTMHYVTIQSLGDSVNFGDIIPRDDFLVMVMRGPACAVPQFFHAVRVCGSAQAAHSWPHYFMCPWVGGSRATVLLAC